VRRVLQDLPPEDEIPLSQCLLRLLQKSPQLVVARRRRAEIFAQMSNWLDPNTCIGYPPPPLQVSSEKSVHLKKYESKEEFYYLSKDFYFVIKSKYHLESPISFENKKIVFSRGNIKKEYNVEDITTLKVKFNLLMGTGTQFYLLINNDKFILRPGNLFIKNRWDSIFNQDKLAHKHADRIKNIIGIKEIK
jgi:hypothetical protein